MRKRMVVLALCSILVMPTEGCGVNTQTVSGIEDELGEDMGSTEEQGDSVTRRSDADSMMASEGLQSFARRVLGSLTNYAKRSSSRETSSADEETTEEIGTNFGVSISDDDDGLGTKNGVGIADGDEEEVGYVAPSTDDNKSSNLAGYAGKDVEFVSYTSQTISETRAMVFSNLSSNDGVQMQFTVKCQGKTKQSDKLNPGEAWTLTSTDLGLPVSKKAVTVTVISQAYTMDGAPLNSVTQDVSVVVADAGEVEETSKVYDNQPNGSKYKTNVIYNADNTMFSVITPAVVAVEQGDIGSDIYVSFRVVNAAAGMKVEVAATGESNKASITLAGENTEVKASLSGATANGAVLTYDFKGGESSLQKVGPIHCTINQGKKAGSDYYGIANFDLMLSGV